MRSVLIGIIAALVLATGAALLLDTGVQRSAMEHYQTGGVRL